MHVHKTSRRVPTATALEAFGACIGTSTNGVRGTTSQGQEIADLFTASMSGGKSNLGAVAVVKSLSGVARDETQPASSWTAPIAASKSVEF